MPYPTPENYPTWDAWGAALLKSLGDSPMDLSVGTTYDQDQASPGTGAGQAPPAGFSALWLDNATADLYLGNDAFDPPTAPDLFQIDTANLALAAVETMNVADAAIHTAKIANAAIVTALIGDLQVVTAKIANLAVDNGKIANLAVTSAKIANLAVGSAHIQLAAITNALIADTIQSASWDGTHGWLIDKTGAITGTQVTILNSDGSVAFSSGHLVSLATQVTGLLPNASVNGLGSIALLNTIAPANTTGFGALSLLNLLTLGDATLAGFGTVAGQNSLAYGSGFLTGFGTLADNNSVALNTGEVTGTLPLTSTSGNLDIVRTTGFGTLAAISLLNSGNIGTYIAGAAIGSALIANLAVGTAAIDNAAITTAKIANLAVGSAQISSVDAIKINAAYLSAISADLGTINAGLLQNGAGTVSFDLAGSGRLTRIAGGYRLVDAAGLGASSDVILWYGLDSIAVGSETRTNGVFALGTDGVVYYASNPLVISGGGAKKYANGTVPVSGTGWVAIVSMSMNGIPAGPFLDILFTLFSAGTATGWDINYRAVEISGGVTTVIVAPTALSVSGSVDIEVLQGGGTATGAYSGVVTYELQVQRVSGTAPRTFSGELTIQATPPG